jgi:hypothetical protein|tara:strand:+ start:600 stop:731 length:132 start_codon:yes stop_codon:yes gene_type:complete
MPPKKNKPLVWKRGVDYIIYNPPRKSGQYEEWKNMKEKQDGKK